MTTLKPSVILDTKYFLALNKPAGWVVNDSKTAHGNSTVQSFIEENFNFEISGMSQLRNGIVHRIDKETSGILLVAKTQDAFTRLQKLFFDREVKKEYLALVHGELKGGGDITAKIGRNPLNRKKFTVLKEGRDAQTSFVVEKVYLNGHEKLTLLVLHPKTGRTHQLRIHLKHIGHPIVSDPLYVGRKTLRNDLVFCPRLFLHAQSVEFIDPFTEKEIFIKAPLPDDLTKALSTLS